MMLGMRRSYLLSAATVAVLAFSGAGCSSLPSVPDWVDPTSWWDSSTPAEPGETPDLASIPDKPGTPAADDQQAVAQQLAADRANAKYSAEALRGGTEPAAAPPPDLPVKPKVAEAPPKPAPKPVTAKAEAAAAVAADKSIAADPAGTSAPGTLPPTAPGIAAAPVAAPDASPAPSPAATPSAASSTPPASSVQTADLPAPPPAAKPARQRVAKAAPPPVSTPAALPAEQLALAPAPAPKPPKSQAAAPVLSGVSPSDAELGFQPSSAPPLDPSVAQFVSAGVIDRYQHTGAAVAPRSAKKGKLAAASLPPDAGAPPAALPPVAGAASSVVYFPGDIVSLNAAAKVLVRTAAEQFKAQGGQGFIRVVGHSSSRTPNMSAEAHTALVQKKSADRANAVARELIREGVPAARVQVEAVGDTQPVYYESMPKGEDGNRRVEIFLQS